MCPAPTSPNSELWSQGWRPKPTLRVLAWVPSLSWTCRSARPDDMDLTSNTRLGMVCLKPNKVLETL